MLPKFNMANAFHQRFSKTLYINHKFLKHSKKIYIAIDMYSYIYVHIFIYLFIKYKFLKKKKKIVFMHI